MNHLLKPLMLLCLFLVIPCHPVLSQNESYITIEGQVIDSNENLPLAGATIRISGKKNIGTATDLSGKFKLSVPTGTESFSVSFIGKETVTVKIRPKIQTYKVMLKDMAATTDVVVVTGYRTISKTRMTGSAESISSEKIANKGFSSVGDILRGQLPGVSARLKSGKLGEQAEIRIRGLNSLYGNMDPIWVVDGVIFKGDLNDLIPEDIESITVLKDAAATALYGSQAANGVIVVERKHGKDGKNINISSTFSFEEAPKSKLKLMNSKQKIAFERDVYEDFPTMAVGGRVIMLLKNADMGIITHQEAEAEIERLSKINTDWYDILFRSPFSQNHNVSLSGGNRTNHYYASLGMRNSHGLVPVNNYNNYNAMLRTQHQFTKKLSISFDLSANIRKNMDSSGGANLLSYATFANPYERPYDENGNIEYDRSYSYGLSTLKDGYKSDFNILEELYNNTTTTNALSARASLGFKWQIFKGLQYSTTFAYNCNYTNTEAILQPGSDASRNRSWIAAIYSELPDELNLGQLTERDTRSESYTWQNQLNYNLSLKDTHFLSVFLGHEISEYKSNNNYTLYPEYDPDMGIFNIPAFGPNQVETIQRMVKNLMDVGQSINRSVSFFTALSYSYKDRYVFSTSARLDGADVIGSQNRFSPLWNLSFRYNLHKEPFIEKLNFISQLAFRFSYGYTGSIDKSALPYNVLSYLTSNKYMDTVIPSYVSPKSPPIKWQKKEDRSFGLEIAFFKNRLQFITNYYNNIIRDLLDTKTLPASSGITNVKYNSSSVLNEGWEFNVQTVNISTRNFMWSTSLNLSTNRSKILESYYKSIEDIPLGKAKTEPVQGTSTNSWLGYRYAGIDPLTGHTLAYVDNSNREKPIGFQREDGKWVLDMDDWLNDRDKIKVKEVLGKSYPPLTGGFGSYFKYKQFSLNLRFSFMVGHKITSAYYAVANSGSISSASKNMHPREASRWRKPGDITDVPGYNMSGLSSSLQTDFYDRKLESGDYLKCTEISLGYNFPRKLLEPIKLKTARINLNMRDVFTLTKYKGLDPENFGGFSYPISRKYMISLSLGF